MPDSTTTPTASPADPVSPLVLNDIEADLRRVHGVAKELADLVARAAYLRDVRDPAYGEIFPAGDADVARLRDAAAEAARALTGWHGHLKGVCHRQSRRPVH
jgi:hypothetical protein